MMEPPEYEDEFIQLREDVDFLLALAGMDVPDYSATPPADSAAGGSSGRAHVWCDLTGPEAAAAWSALTEWVDWLIARYGLEDVVPTCWYRHGAMLDELDGLRAAWTGAYLGASAQPTDACQWLELFARAVARIGEWDRYGCAAGTHHDDPPAAAEAADDERLAYVHADIAARTSGELVESSDVDVPRQLGADPGDGQGDGSGDFSH